MEEDRRDDGFPDEVGDSRGVEKYVLVTDEGGLNTGDGFCTLSREVGGSGNVVELGIGLGEGMFLKDSRDDRRSADGEGEGERRVKAGLSIRLQDMTRQ